MTDRARTPGELVASTIVIEITYTEPVTADTVRAVVEANSGFAGQESVRGALVLRHASEHWLEA